MKKIVVSISDMKITTNQNALLVTYSLGSCLGLTVYDPLGKIGGLVHCLLPASTNGNRPINPYMYVNTGVTAMVRKMLALGANLEQLVFKAAGCGRMMEIIDSLDIGSQNFAMLQTILNKNKVRLAAKDVGDSIPRTMTMYMETGQVIISSKGKEWNL